MMALLCRLAILLLIGLPLVCLAAEEAGGETEGETPEVDVEGEVGTVEGASKSREFTFQPPDLDDRRDIFYDVVATQRAKEQAAALRLKKEQQDADIALTQDSGGKSIKITGPDLPQIEEKADEALREIQDHFIARKWEKVIKLCDKHLAELNKHIETFPDSQHLKNVKQRIRNHKIQAEEKRRYELAKAEFDALGVVVEGIIWSAEGESLAIINDEPVALGVNDKVRNDAAVIVNIDSNRVDFMIVQDANTFHFQRYIGEAE